MHESISGFLFSLINKRHKYFCQNFRKPPPSRYGCTRRSSYFFEYFMDCTKFIKLHFAEILQQKINISLSNVRNNFFVTFTNEIIKINFAFVRKDRIHCVKLTRQLDFFGHSQCLKFVWIYSFSDLHFLAFGLNTDSIRMLENTD